MPSKTSIEVTGLRAIHRTKTPRNADRWDPGLYAAVQKTPDFDSSKFRFTRMSIGIDYDSQSDDVYYSLEAIAQQLGREGKDEPKIEVVTSPGIEKALRDELEKVFDTKGPKATWSISDHSPHSSGRFPSFTKKPIGLK